MIGATTSLRFVGASAAFIVYRHSLVGKISLFASDRQVKSFLGFEATESWWSERHYHLEITRGSRFSAAVVKS